MLKWTSESEYFLSFENFFADTIYHIIQSKSNHFTPSAAHARRGVINIKCYPSVHSSWRSTSTNIVLWKLVGPVKVPVKA